MPVDGQNITETCSINFFTVIPCILILSKFFLFTNWCTRELL